MHFSCLFSQALVNTATFVALIFLLFCFLKRYFILSCRRSITAPCITIFFFFFTTLLSVFIFILIFPHFSIHDQHLLLLYLIFVLITWDNVLYCFLHFLLVILLRPVLLLVLIFSQAIITTFSVAIYLYFALPAVLSFILIIPPSSPRLQLLLLVS